MIQATKYGFGAIIGIALGMIAVVAVCAIVFTSCTAAVIHHEATAVTHHQSTSPTDGCTTYAAVAAQYASMNMLDPSGSHMNATTTCAPDSAVQTVEQLGGGA